MRRVKPLHLFWKRIALFNVFIMNIHVSLCSINLCLENGPQKVYFKKHLSNTPNTVYQIQIQIHGLKIDQIQILIRRICICICICKYKYVFDPSPDHITDIISHYTDIIPYDRLHNIDCTSYWYRGILISCNLVLLSYPNGITTDVYNIILPRYHTILISLHITLILYQYWFFLSFIPNPSYH